MDDKERQAGKELALARLQEKWKPTVQCPICKTEAWTLGELVEAPLRGPVLSEAGLPQVFAFVPLFCDNCGYTMLLNAKILGALELPQEAEQEATAVEPET